jgi:hypothetical protein
MERGFKSREQCHGRNGEWTGVIHSNQKYSFAAI